MGKIIKRKRRNVIWASQQKYLKKKFKILESANHFWNVSTTEERESEGSRDKEREKEK
jgi:hypothetical protein